MRIRALAPLGAAALACAIAFAPASAQRVSGAHEGNGTATAAELVGVNAIIGGVTAATQALIRKKDPFRAFGVGAFGGLVHLLGKNLAVEPSPAHGWLGLVVAGTGSSVVANGGRGVTPWEEITIPIGPTRLRFTPRDSVRFRFAVNVFESAVLTRAFLRDGLRLDWGRSAATGVFVFHTRDLRVLRDGQEVWGIAVAPIAVVSAFAVDSASVVRHEVVHVHQHWFVQDTWGRPIEGILRRRIPGARRIPAWLELGAGGQALLILEGRINGGAGADRLMEAEADLLDRR